MSEPEHAIHLPPPSFSPFLVAVGALFISFGILYGIALIVIGGVFFLAGLSTWLVDDARAYVKAGDPTDGGHGHH